MTTLITPKELEVADLQRCYAEQRAAAEYLKTDPTCHGARMGITDWVAEEIFIRFIRAEYEIARNTARNTAKEAA